ncbi:hypothetical protein GCM10009850_119570 [Nonomuraea monospora]|uniref:HTH cro/C1-type domain-containing protein n=1 Tax=Nonomuraea monospora TaxID=568818 RepID=A0ABN3D441_9ACTN
MRSDPWTTTRARAFLSTRDVGSALRYARTLLGLRQADVGRAAYCSASTISRLETGRHGADLDLIRRVATAVAIPPHVLAALTGLGSPAHATVTSPTTAEREDDPMRRRTLFTAAATAVPAALLARIEDALAVIPSVPARPLTAAQLTTRLARATRLFDRGEVARLVADLPELLAVAHDSVERRPTPEAFIGAAACYGLATEALSKAGRQASSRLAADRAIMLARLSGSPTSIALASRCLGVVLRHEGRHALADQVVLEAAGQLEATGLTRAPELAVYGQVLCSAAYTAAQHGDRARALELIGDAAAAVRRLPRPPRCDACPARCPRPCLASRRSSRRPRCGCTRWACTGAWATPPLHGAPAAPSTPPNSPPRNAAHAFTPTWPGSVGNRKDPSTPSPSY